MTKSEIETVKRLVYLGLKVKVITEIGKCRNKVKTDHGVVTEIHNNFFTAEIQKGGSKVRESFQYIDLLTTNPKVKLFKEAMCEALHA